MSDNLVVGFDLEHYAIVTLQRTTPASGVEKNEAIALGPEILGILRVAYRWLVHKARHLTGRVPP